MIYKKNCTTFVAVNVILSFIPILVMVVQHRIPSTHDTFSYLISQYSVYNEAVTKAALPFWMPYITHGQNSALMVSFQLNPFSPVIWLLGFIGVKINFMWLYFMGMWFDELMFQVGIYLLATIYYRRLETAAFVASCLVGSIVWSNQIWNFHQIYFLPLALYSLHMTITKCGKIKWVFLLALFLSFGVNSVATYNIVFTLFVMLTYFLSIIPVHYNDLKSFFNIRSIVAFFFKTVVVAALFLFSVINVPLGLKSLDLGGRGRDLSGAGSLDMFMSYGGSIGFTKYFDFLFRAPQSTDMSLYVGTLLIPLVLFGLVFYRDKYSISLVTTSLIVFLFCAGTPITIAAYHLFPGFKFFRHIGLVAPVLKVFLVFLAGYGFEALIDHPSKRKYCYMFVCLYCIVVASLYWVLNNGLFPIVFPSAYSVEIKSLFFVLAALIVSSLTARYSNVIAGIYPMIIVVIMIIDLFVFRIQYQVMTVPVATKSFVSMFMPVDYKFQENRDNKSNLRYQKFFGSIHRWNDRDMTLYDPVDWLLYKDFMSSPFVVMVREKPVAELAYYASISPDKSSWFESLSQPKLRVYQHIHYVKDITAIREMLVASAGKDDLLYAEVSSASVVEPLAFQANPHSDRVNANFKVINFRANGLVLEVDDQLINQSDGNHYLYYADAFHSFWKARVNGNEVPVIKVNTAYKAVKIPAGKKSVVEFYIHSPLVTSSMLLAQWLALVAFLATFYFCYKICCSKKEANAKITGL